MSRLPSPPFVEVEGVDNFRDIGGWAAHPPTSATQGSQDNPTSRALSVRRNFCFRSADPSRITDAGKAKLEALGLTTVYDLRSGPEIKKSLLQAPGLHLDGVTVVHTPVFPDRDMSPEGIAVGYANYARGGPEGFTRAYRDILENGVRALRSVFVHVRDRPGEPFLCHCSGGKDRTGVLVALMLRLVGVRDEDIAREYELTDRGLEFMKPILISFLLNEPGVDGNEEAVKNMISSKYENMIAVLQMLNDEYGGAEGYMKNYCGFTDDDLDLMRKNLMDETPPVL